MDLEKYKWYILGYIFTIRGAGTLIHAKELYQLTSVIFVITKGYTFLTIEDKKLRKSIFSVILAVQINEIDDFCVLLHFNIQCMSLKYGLYD